MNDLSDGEDRGLARAKDEHDNALAHGLGHVVPFTTLEQAVLALGPNDPDPPGTGLRMFWNMQPGHVINVSDITAELADVWGYVRQSRRLRARRQKKQVGELTVFGPVRPVTPLVRQHQQQ
jgi:hypothetical protein